MQDHTDFYRLVVVFRSELPLCDALHHLWNVVCQVELAHLFDQGFQVDLLNHLELANKLLDLLIVAHKVLWRWWSCALLQQSEVDLPLC